MKSQNVPFVYFDINDVLLLLLLLLLFFLICMFLLLLSQYRAEVLNNLRMMCELKNYILLLYYDFHINCEFKNKQQETDERMDGQTLAKH